MIRHQAKDGYFRKSGKQANLHKNLFFGLVYLHALLKGRKNYGHLGWNLEYQFDFSDFEVSSAQLASVVRTISAQRPASRPAALKVLSYFYGQVNYAGKIQRAVDQTVLEAITGDLINERVGSANKAIARDYGASTFGIPTEACTEPERWLMDAIPDDDPY
jgi:dynein heavy chain